MRKYQKKSIRPLKLTETITKKLAIALNSHHIARTIALKAKKIARLNFPQTGINQTNSPENGQHCENP
jgi:uncharacterized protein YhbP (UPF0306 family)